LRGVPGKVRQAAQKTTAACTTQQLIKERQQCRILITLQTMMQTLGAWH
jgi:hypothetical protein